MADEDFVEERRFWAWENHRGFLLDVGASVEYEEDDDYDYDDGGFDCGTRLPQRLSRSSACRNRNLSVAAVDALVWRRS
jgi:hypothetical protein